MVWWDIIVSLIVSAGFAVAFVRSVRTAIGAAALTLVCSWALTIAMVVYLTHGHWQIMRSALVPILIAAATLFFKLTRHRDVCRPR